MTEVGAEEKLIQVLWTIRLGSARNDEAIAEIRRLILQIGSETEDNLSCLDHLDVGSVPPFTDWMQKSGVKLRGRAALISDVLSCAEHSAVPLEVIESHPGLTHAEWGACLRFAVHLLLVFERNLLEHVALEEP